MRKAPNRGRGWMIAGVWAATASVSAAAVGCASRAGDPKGTVPDAHIPAAQPRATATVSAQKPPRPARPASRVAEPAKRLATSGGTTCAILDGDVHCWSNEQRPTSVARVPHMELPSNAIDMDRSSRTGCAVLATGAVYCWDSNSRGLLGAASPLAESRKPLRVVELNDALRVRVGPGHVCVLRREGRVSCWGHNRNGAVSGDVAYTEAARRLVRPVEVPIVDATRLWVSERASCVVDGDSKLQCWGRIGRAQYTSPHVISERIDAQNLDFGTHGACIVHQGGTFQCTRPLGDIADIATTQQLKPRTFKVPVSQVALASFFGCSRHRDGGVQCWTPTDDGMPSPQLPPYTPSPVLGVRGAEEIAVGGFGRACARTDKAVHCWEAAGAKMVTLPLR